MRKSISKASVFYCSNSAVKNRRLLTRVMVALLAFGFSSCSKQSIAPAVEVPTKPSPAEVVTNELSFSGYKWKVRDSRDKQSPGPNFWNKGNVWVDGEGKLHLIIRKNEETGNWESAEVYTTEKLGYGSYQWQIEGALDKLDKNIVLGLFNYSGNNMFDEMDIEIARWGNDAWPNLNYTIYPETGKTTEKHKSYTQFFSLNNSQSTHRIKRYEDRLELQSLNGFTDSNSGMFATKEFTKADITMSSLKMPVFINVWLFEGKVPSDNKSVEIIIDNFRFTPF